MFVCQFGFPQAAACAAEAVVMVMVGEVAEVDNRSGEGSAVGTLIVRGHDIVGMVIA